MFWRVSGLNTASPIDAILDREEYSLEDLLNEDELIQECKSLNARLTTFLKQKATVKKLVSYLIEDAPPDADTKRQFKYPFAACEIFCCEVEGVFNTLLESDELLDELFALLHRPRPLNSMLAGYFARVVGSLLLRRSADVMQFLQRRQELLTALVHHVDTTSVAEVLARLVGADDPRGYPTPGALQWLAATDLPQQLADQLGPAAPTEAQANAAEVLAAVARSTSSPLTACLASPEFMERLVDKALAPHEGRAATHALNVCIALLEPPPPSDPTMQHGPGVPADGPAAEVHERLRAQAIRCVSAAAERLVVLLDGAGEAQLHTSYGLIRQPVGQLRLKAVDLLAALLRTGDPGAEDAVVATRAVQLAMELFQAYPFNNALHSGVAALLTSFEPGSDSLRNFLLREAGLVDWLVAVPDEVLPEPNPEDPLADSRRPLRAGYCGHITQIANRLLHLADRSQAVRDYVMAHDGWQAFVRERLEPRNKLESVFAWQCGRPGSHPGEMDGEGGMYGQTEMEFTALESGGGFTRDVYQRYGVYDNDDDEEESTAPEWTMELPGAGAPGKLAQPPTSFAAALDDSSGSDSDGEEAAGAGRGAGVAAGEADLVVVGSLPAGGVAGPLGDDDMADMHDDAVVLEVEGAEGIAELQRQMEERLTLAVGPSGEGAAPGSPPGVPLQAASAATDPGAVPVAAQAANGNDEGQAAAGGEGGGEGAAGEEAAVQEFNSNVFWRPTFAVHITEE